MNTKINSPFRGAAKKTAVKKTARKVADPVLKFLYTTAEGKSRVRTVVPKELKVINGIWTLIGTDRTRKAIRSFHMNRIKAFVS